MPLKFDIKKKLCSRSERVKCVDLHPELPWVLSALYSGNITIYDYSTQSTVKTFEISTSPVRSAKFIIRKQWIVTGSDDLMIRIFNYNTMEKIKTLEGHTDYIRCLSIHPTQSLILSSGDDATIRIWDWEKDFTLVKTLEEHIHYVMQLAFNPRDANTFASASLDKTIKIWSITTAGHSNFTLTGHQSGVNCVDYYKGDKPYIISGGDDKLVKIWDYQTKQCLHTLEGHMNNISSVMYHPEIPIILSCSEDGSVKIWHSNTYRLEMTLNYNMDRVWSLDACKDQSNIIAIGYDDGTVVIKIGSDEPIVSMNNGKVIIAKNLEILTTNLKAIDTAEDQVKDGEKINFQTKELGVADIFPQNLKHAPNGHTFVISSDDEYSIFRAQSFKNVAFGNGQDFQWSTTGDYAVKDSHSVKIFKGSTNGQEISLKPDYIIEGIFGGLLLGVKSTEFMVFYDWTTAKIIRRIDISPKKVFWNDAGTMVALITNEDFFVLNYKPQVVSQQLNTIQNEDGIEEAFDLVYEIHETVTSGLWISDCFFFTNANGRLNYAVGGKVFTQTHIDKKKFILGYIQGQNRLYLIDKHFNVVSYEILSSITEYQSAITAKNYKKALQLQEVISKKYYDKLARFLDQLDLKEEAFHLAQDMDHKFELAIQLNKIEEAFKIAEKEKSHIKWKQVGDIALISGKIEMAIQCFKACDDLSGLLLIYSSLGLKDKLRALAKRAEELTRTNIAFVCYFNLADINACIDLLIKAKRIPEAAFFSKTYCPSRISELVQLWRDSLAKSHPVASQKIADPMEHLDQFEDLVICEKLEKFLGEKRAELPKIPSHHFNEFNELFNQDFFSVLKADPNADLNQVFQIPEIHKINPLREAYQAEEEQMGTENDNVNMESID